MSLRSIPTPPQKKTKVKNLWYKSTVPTWITFLPTKKWIMKCIVFVLDLLTRSVSTPELAADYIILHYSWSFIIAYHTMYDHWLQNTKDGPMDAMKGSKQNLHVQIPFHQLLFQSYIITSLTTVYLLDTYHRYPIVQNNIAPSDPPLANNFSWTGCQDKARTTNYMLKKGMCKLIILKWEFTITHWPLHVQWPLYIHVYIMNPSITWLLKTEILPKLHVLVNRKMSTRRSFSISTYNFLASYEDFLLRKILN